MESLERLMQFVSTFAEENGFSQKRMQELELATEEALVNIFHYAYPDGKGDVEVSCVMEDDTLLVIEILDRGVPFDVGSFSEPDLSPNIAERKIGGLGIFLIRKMADQIKYRRDGEKNILTLWIRK